MRNVRDGSIRTESSMATMGLPAKSGGSGGGRGKTEWTRGLSNEEKMVCLPDIDARKGSLASSTVDAVCPDGSASSPDTGTAGLVSLMRNCWLVRLVGLPCRDEPT